MKKLLKPIFISTGLVAILSLQPAMAKGNCQVQSQHQFSDWSFNEVKGGSHHRRGGHHRSRDHHNNNDHRSSEHRSNNHPLENWYYLGDVLNKHHRRHASTERHHGSNHR